MTYSRDPCCAGPQHPIECPHEAAVPAALPRRKVLLALFHDGGALSGAVPAEPDGDARLEDFALAAWARYAAVHGYSFLHGDPGCAAGRRANWLKVCGLQRLLEEWSGDWVVLLDTDTYMVQPQARLEELFVRIADDKHIALSEDWGKNHRTSPCFVQDFAGGWNTGIVLVRSSSAARHAVERWFEAPVDCIAGDGTAMEPGRCARARQSLKSALWDQRAFAVVLMEDAYLRSLVHVFPSGCPINTPFGAVIAHLFSGSDEPATYHATLAARTNLFRALAAAYARDGLPARMTVCDLLSANARVRIAVHGRDAPFGASCESSPGAAQGGVADVRSLLVAGNDSAAEEAAVRASLDVAAAAELADGVRVRKGTCAASKWTTMLATQDCSGWDVCPLHGRFAIQLPESQIAEQHVVAWLAGRDGRAPWVASQFVRIQRYSLGRWGLQFIEAELTELWATAGQVFEALGPIFASSQSSTGYIVMPSHRCLICCEHSGRPRIRVVQSAFLRAAEAPDAAAALRAGDALAFAEAIVAGLQAGTGAASASVRAAASARTVRVEDGALELGLRPLARPEHWERMWGSARGIEAGAALAARRQAVVRV